MATYTAVFHINLSVDIEAENEDEAREKLDFIDIFGETSLDGCEAYFDYLIDEDGIEYL
jgi:hypothetical protein